MQSARVSDGVCGSQRGGRRAATKRSYREEEEESDGDGGEGSPDGCSSPSQEEPAGAQTKKPPTKRAKLINPFGSRCGSGPLLLSGANLHEADVAVAQKVQYRLSFDRMHLEGCCCCCCCCCCQMHSFAMCTPVPYRCMHACKILAASAILRTLLCRQQSLQLPALIVYVPCSRGGAAAGSRGGRGPGAGALKQGEAIA